MATIRCNKLTSMRSLLETFRLHVASKPSYGPVGGTREEFHLMWLKASGITPNCHWPRCTEHPESVLQCRLWGIVNGRCTSLSVAFAVKSNFHPINHFKTKMQSMADFTAHSSWYKFSHRHGASGDKSHAAVVLLPHLYDVKANVIGMSPGDLHHLTNSIIHWHPVLVNCLLLIEFRVSVIKAQLTVDLHILVVNNQRGTCIAKQRANES